jgi:hypothetical protein
VTSGICELVVGNMDADSSKGVVVGHACGEADADVFVLLLLSMCLPFWAQVVHPNMHVPCTWGSYSNSRALAMENWDKIIYSR